MEVIPYPDRKKIFARNCNKKEMFCYENFCSISHVQSSHQNVAHQTIRTAKRALKLINI
jgi:hypothetical protein